MHFPVGYAVYETDPPVWKKAMESLYSLDLLGLFQKEINVSIPKELYFSHT